MQRAAVGSARAAERPRRRRRPAVPGGLPERQQDGGRGAPAVRTGDRARGEDERGAPRCSIASDLFYNSGHRTVGIDSLKIS
eukprot:SAG31_NODE_184_length_20985_cov_28.867567_19_plen_82_part_00